MKKYIIKNLQTKQQRVENDLQNEKEIKIDFATHLQKANHGVLTLLENISVFYSYEYLPPPNGIDLYHREVLFTNVNETIIPFLRITPIFRSESGFKVYDSEGYNNTFYYIWQRISSNQYKLYLYFSSYSSWYSSVFSDVEIPIKLDVKLSWYIPQYF